MIRSQTTSAELSLACPDEGALARRIRLSQALATLRVVRQPA